MPLTGRRCSVAATYVWLGRNQIILRSLTTWWKHKTTQAHSANCTTITDWESVKSLQEGVRGLVWGNIAPPPLRISVSNGIWRKTRISWSFVRFLGTRILGEWKSRLIDYKDGCTFRSHTMNRYGVMEAWLHILPSALQSECHFPYIYEMWGSHSGVKTHCLLVCDAVSTGKQCPTFLKTWPF
jgi:hypothetical protein